MFCAVYKSKIRSSTYLYIKNKDQFDRVPKPLLEKFGQPVFVMVLDLGKREKLALANIEKVRASLLADGFYLQLPPSPDKALSYIRDQNHKLF